MIVSLFRFLADSLRLGLYAGLFFMIMVCVSYFAIGHYIKGQEIAAPDVTGKPLVEALENLRDLDLSATLDRRQPNGNVRENTVVGQSPKPGSPIKAGTPIRLVVSTHEALVTVPDLRNEMRQMAGIKLRDLGLDVGSIAYVSRQGKEGGIVLETDPPGGSGIVAKGKVNLLVTSGEPQARKMANLVGLKPSQAKELLTEFGLTLSSELAEPGGGAVAQGRIYRQTPSPGEPITPTTPISIVYEPMTDEMEEGEVPAVDLGEDALAVEQPEKEEDAGAGFQWLQGGDREDRSGARNRR